jgi:hypothetical protein
VLNIAVGIGLGSKVRLALGPAGAILAAAGAVVGTVFTHFEKPPYIDFTALSKKSQCDFEKNTNFL